MAEFKFDVGDRVDYMFYPGTGGQGTPGTVASRLVRNNHPFYRVYWDDGFVEDPSEINANWWPEDELVPDAEP